MKPHPKQRADAMAIYSEQDAKRFRHGCAYKVRFDSKKIVRAKARVTGLHAYKCPFCGGYHLSKKPGDVA